MRHFGISTNHRFLAFVASLCQLIACSGTSTSTLDWFLIDYRSPGTTIYAHGYKVQVLHLAQDAPGMNRVLISGHGMTLEILPTKGLSVGQWSVDHRPVFWEAPVDLPQADSLDLLDASVRINGDSTQGVSFLRTFMGGIELYGLENWGMHYTDAAGKFYPLHGTTSNIPVDSLCVSLSDSALQVRGVFRVRSLVDAQGSTPWYQSGEAKFLLERNIKLSTGKPELYLSDQITNISPETLTPDIGYHVTLYPEPGAEILVPAKIIENRGGGKIPDNHPIWPPSTDFQLRTEVGVIRKDLKQFPGLLGEEIGTQSLVSYPDGRAVSIRTLYFPYYQTWLCSGGAGSSEFTDLQGRSIITRNWDGIGVEFGTSALDHDGNIDSSYQWNTVLDPGASLEIPIRVALLSPEETQNFSREIIKYNDPQRP